MPNKWRVKRRGRSRLRWEDGAKRDLERVGEERRTTAIDRYNWNVLNEK